MSVKERVIGACILVALAVIFIPMLVEKPNPEAVVTTSVDLPEPSTAVKAYRLSLTENSPPEPISPLVAAGKAPRHSGEINRTADNAPPRAQAKPETTAAVTPKPSTAGTTQSAPPEESAEAPARDPADDRPGWAVQVGSFANHDNASRLVSRLKDKGFHAFVRQYTHAGKTYYRVRVGPVDARREAEKLAPAVAAASGGPTKVVPNP